jgi:hypothetical protein
MRDSVVFAGTGFVQALLFGGELADLVVLR